MKTSGLTIGKYHDFSGYSSYTIGKYHDFLMILKIRIDSKQPINVKEIAKEFNVSKAIIPVLKEL